MSNDELTGVWRELELEDERLRRVLLELDTVPDWRHQVMASGKTIGESADETRNMLDANENVLLKVKAANENVRRQSEEGGKKMLANLQRSNMMLQAILAEMRRRQAQQEGNPRMN